MKLVEKLTKGILAEKETEKQNEHTGKTKNQNAEFRIG